MTRLRSLIVVALVCTLAWMAPIAEPAAAGWRSRLSPEETQLLSLLDVRNSRAHVDALFALGQKSVGSEAIRLAADYVEAHFRALGFREDSLTMGLERQGFPSKTWVEEDGGFFRVRGATGQFDVGTFAAYGHGLGTWGTGSGELYFNGNADGGKTIRAEIVEVGIGTAEDYARAPDVSGKAVLVRRDDFFTIWPTPAVHEAKLHGAMAIIFYGQAGSRKLDDAVMQDSVGGPIPAISISRNDANRIRALLEEGPVEVEIQKRVDRRDERTGRAENVIAYLWGTAHRNEFILFDAHFDTWFGGANDALSGVATILEAARVFTEATQAGLYRPDRTLVFFTRGPGELGGPINTWFDWAVGSYEFHLAHREVTDHLVAAFEDAHLGFGSATAFLSTTPEISSLMPRLLKDLELDDRIFMAFDYPSFSGGWIFGPVAGGSSIEIFTIMPGFGATVSHTNLDTPDRLSDENLLAGLQINVLGASRLNGALFYPINLAKLAQWSLREMAQHEIKASEPLLASDFRAAATALESLKDSYLDLLVNVIEPLEKEFRGRATTPERRAEIRAIADRVNAALIAVRQEVSHFVWGTGTSMAGWIGFFRTLQHADDLGPLNSGLALLAEGRLKEALRSLEGINFLDWAHKFSKSTHDAMIGEQFENLYWGAEWGQQQEYVFIFDEYATLRDIAEGGSGSLAFVGDGLARAREDLVAFIREDLRNIAAKAKEGAEILGRAG